MKNNFFREVSKMKFIRPRMIKEKTGLSLSTVNRLEKLGEFPKRRKLSEGSVGWLESEIDAWAERRARV
jgi:prophage regulatory protein